VINIGTGLFVGDVENAVIAELHVEALLFALVVDIYLEQLEFDAVQSNEFEVAFAEFDIKISDHGAKLIALKKNQCFREVTSNLSSR